MLLTHIKLSFVYSIKQENYVPSGTFQKVGWQQLCVIHMQISELEAFTQKGCTVVRNAPAHPSKNCQTMVYYL
jgi:hypothetical protein